MNYLLLSLGGVLLAPAALAQTATTTGQTGMEGQTPAQTTPAPMTTPAPSTASPTSPSASSPAVPQTPTVGATVYGIGGTPVGTIKSVEPQFVTLTTPKGDVRLPSNGIGPGPNGLRIALTAAQLDAAVSQARAAQGGASTSATTTGDTAASTSAGGDTNASTSTTTTTKSTRRTRSKPR